MTLYHYTCAHSMEAILRSGHLYPRWQATLAGIPLIWLTDLPTPVDGLGLSTTGLLTCDRTAYRVTVPDEAAQTWHAWARAHLVSRTIRDTLEHGCLPAHWWVADVPLPVLAVEATR